MHTIKELYQISDIGVLPSFVEQCSYVGIEMMMFGLPIVGTTGTGLSEMIDNGVNGYKVRLNEVDASVSLNTQDLADNIVSAIDNSSFLSKNSRDYYEAKYQIFSMIDKMNSIILDL